MPSGTFSSVVSIRSRLKREAWLVSPTMLATCSSASSPPRNAEARSVRAAAEPIAPDSSLSVSAMTAGSARIDGAGSSLRCAKWSRNATVEPFPPQAVGTRHPGNPVDFLWSLRALLMAMDSWISDGKAPPQPSR